MGEPAGPTPKERAATRDLATSIIEAVRNDERHPLAPGDHGTLIDCGEREIEMAMMQMAQEIVALKAELDAANDVYSRVGAECLCGAFEDNQP